MWSFLFSTFPPLLLIFLGLPEVPVFAKQMPKHEVKSVPSSQLLGSRKSQGPHQMLASLNCLLTSHSSPAWSLQPPWLMAVAPQPQDTPPRGAQPSHSACSDAYLTISIIRPWFQFLRALPNFNHLGCNPACQKLSSS